MGIGNCSILPFAKIPASNGGLSPISLLPSWTPQTFLTTNSASDNVIALNDALTNHRSVMITTPGVYEIDNTIWIPSNTRLEFVAGCTVKKATGSNFTFVFANTGITTVTRNTNITVLGNGLIIDQNGEDDITQGLSYRMRGLVNFFHVDNLTLDGFNHTGGGAGQFFGHLGDITNFSIKNMNVETLKAAFQFQGKCFDGLLEDIVTDSWDDSLALNALDWSVVSASVGNIERVIIRRWTDNQIVHGAFANGCRMQPGSWDDWGTGVTYNLSDFCVNNGNVYVKSSATAQVSSVAPTHADGKITGADNIEWWWVQTGSEKAACIKDITYEDINVNASSRHIGVQNGDDDTYRSIFPGTEGNGYIDNIVFDNISYNPPAEVNNYLFEAGGYIKKLTLKNSDISPVNDCALFGLSSVLTGIDGYIDDVIIDNCNITLNSNSKILEKQNLCAGKNVTVSNSVVIINGQELLYFYQLNTERHADITLTNVSVTGMLQILEYGHGYDIDIVATDCEFIDADRIVYRAGTDGAGVTFTSTGCTFNTPNEDFLFKSADNKLSINVSDSHGAPNGFKIHDTNVNVIACDFQQFNTQYANPGGNGDRSAIIAASQSSGIFGLGSAVNLIDGGGGNTAYFDGSAVSGKYLLFDFGAGIKKLITEINLTQSGVQTHGVWQFQGSNEASATPSNGSFVNIGNTFTLVGWDAVSVYITEMSGNLDGYRHYRLLGVSGNTNGSPYVRKIYFKIDDVS